MKTNKLALIAIFLWVATVATFAWFFVKGNTVKGTDDRTAVVLDDSERNLILAEMRGLLSATHGILAAINTNDMKQVSVTARTVGMANAADVNPALMAKLPLAFKQHGMSVHRSMDLLADAADAGKPVAEIQGMLTNTLASCVACHATWQLQAAK